VRDQVSHSYKTRGKVIVLWKMLNLHVFRYETGRKRIPTCVAANVPRIRSALSFLLNAILTCYPVLKHLVIKSVPVIKRLNWSFGIIRSHRKRVKNFRSNITPSRQ
jgi:hypothetical protein